MFKVISNLLKGAILGPAMVIPGVSGGTMALILGIYDRLIKALHSFSLGTLKDILSLRLDTLWQKNDLKFLLTLLAGATLSVFPCMLLIDYLFTWHPQPTKGFFFGLVGASIIFPLRLMKRKGSIELLCALAAIAITIPLGMNQDRRLAEKQADKTAVVATAETATDDKVPEPDHSPGNCLRFAFSGALASAAMLLPGISGSFLLLLLGIYQEVLVFVNPLAPGFDPLLGIIFIASCIAGVVLFARLINLLLDRCHSPTMAFLGGLMLGSLWNLWPFRSPGSSAPAWPDEVNSTAGLCLLTCVAGASIITALAFYKRKAGDDDDGRGETEA